MPSDDGIEHEEVRGSCGVENGGRILGVRDRGREKLAQTETVSVEAGFDHTAMDLRDLGKGLTRFEQRNERLIRAEDGARSSCVNHIWAGKVWIFCLSRVVLTNEDHEPASKLRRLKRKNCRKT